MFNPPENRDEIKDTLFFLNVDFDYEKIYINDNHVFQLTLEDAVIRIFNPRKIMFNKTLFQSVYDMKRYLMTRYL